MERSAFVSLSAGLVLSLAAAVGAQPRGDLVTGTVVYGGARDAGPQAAPDAGVGVQAMLDAATAGRTVLATGGRRSRAREEVEVALGVQRGACYELVGAALGAAQVRVELRLRAALVGEPTPLGNSRAEAARFGFCVSESPELYRLVVLTEGAATWRVALLEDRTRSLDAGARPRPTVFADAGPRRVTEVFAPGGAEQDYVGSQLRALAASRPNRVAMNAAERRVLSTNEAIERSLDLPAGRCIEAAAAGVPSVADLELSLEDPNGNRVAQDGTRRATESVRFCPVYAGLYRLRVRVRAGAGMVANQTFIER
ncbi:MAG: hypothetical protein JNK72_03190 [Myxococcales bacterium]|nr:hypothetical protein [Myxococcales bacterium]